MCYSYPYEITGHLKAFSFPRMKAVKLIVRPNDGKTPSLQIHYAENATVHDHVHLRGSKVKRVAFTVLGPYCFKLLTKRRSILFQCASAVEREFWVHLLQGLGEAKKSPTASSVE